MPRKNMGLIPYEKLDLETVNGCPVCPECGTVMRVDRGKWSCFNPECSVVSITSKKGLSRVVRDSIMYSEKLLCSGEVDVVGGVVQ